MFILGLLLANWLGLEVVDMDGRRVDKVLVRPAGEVQVEPSTDATSGATDPSAN